MFMLQSTISKCINPTLHTNWMETSLGAVNLAGNAYHIMHKDLRVDMHYNVGI